MTEGELCSSAHEHLLMQLSCTLRAAPSCLEQLDCFFVRAFWPMFCWGALGLPQDFRLAWMVSALNGVSL